MAGGVRRLVLLAVPVGVRGLGREVRDDVAPGPRRPPRDGPGRAAARRRGRLGQHRGGRPRRGDVDRGRASPPCWPAARADLRPTASRALRDAGDGCSSLRPRSPPPLTASARRPSPPRSTTPAPTWTGWCGPGSSPPRARPGSPTCCATCGASCARLEKLPEAPGPRRRRAWPRSSAVEARLPPPARRPDPEPGHPAGHRGGLGARGAAARLFAQTIGAKGKVSATRVTRELDALFAGDLD